MCVMEKAKSHMLAISNNKNDITDVKIIVEKLNAASSFKLIDYNLQKCKIITQIEYKKNIYEVELYLVLNFDIPTIYNATHYFPDIDLNKINDVKMGIAIDMYFSDNYLISYLLQLKVIDAIYKDKLAVVDYNSEKILSGKWVSIVAKSEIPPSPKYTYTAQAVSAEGSCVWIHTHGLSRFGITELEILNSTKDTYQSHYIIIETMANKLVESNEKLNIKEPMYLAKLSNEILITTIVPWYEAIELYDYNMIGGKNSRKDSHNRNTSVVFVYNSLENLKNCKYEPINTYDHILQENSAYIITDVETSRMKALAMERLDYLRQAILNNENKILIKIGLGVEKEYRDESDSCEHMWFELEKIYEKQVVCKLTQEPYYIHNIHIGDICTYNIDCITDWLIFTPTNVLSPDDVYLLGYD